MAQCRHIRHRIGMITNYIIFASCKEFNNLICALTLTMYISFTGSDQQVVVLSFINSSTEYLPVAFI